ncbi:COG4315 family predicted lipoprotein [Agromyces soli]
MNARIATGAAVAALALLLTGCSGPGGTQSSGEPSSGDGGYGMTSETPEPSAEAPSGDAALATAESSLGEIVVDGTGMTVYVFDKDAQGAATSACTGDCLANWPPVVVDSADPAVDGVTGEVGTITTPDGALQATLDGWPLYTFAGDAAPGAVNGQGVNGVWWVVAPDGTKIGG